jgi:ATP-dependent helicase/nuclease subunit B
MQLFAERLIENGVAVDLLIWQPGHTDRITDTWGRPDPQAWSERTIEIKPEVIKQVKEPIDETQLAVDFALRASPAGDYAIVMGDPNLGNAFKTEFWSRGGTAYLPEGEGLLQSEAATLLLEWESFRKTHDLRKLRRLLEIPAFAQWLDTKKDFKQSIALSACDALLSQSVVATLQQGRALTAVPLPKDARPAEQKARRGGRVLLAKVQTYINVTGLELLSTLCENGMLKTSDASQRVLEMGQTLHESPVFKKWPEGIMPSFARALREEQIPKPPSTDVVDINGWLEAPWLEAGRLALCGLIEGCLPSTLDGHPFLPDSLRADLGLTNNAARFARDAYLLDCLLHTRAPSELQCFSSKFDATGNPNRPSRLLLSCHSNELPDRILQLTGKVSSVVNRATRQNNWLWQLPVSVIPKVEKITPTQFKGYLACPFRFCLSQVLKLKEFTPTAREMNAAVFGVLVHSALESFGNQAIGMGDKMLTMKEDVIRKCVLDAFTKITYEHFGRQPTPAVRIQIENARTRLIAFARVQAGIFEEGWMIVDVEKKLSADGETPLLIGPLKLSGIIDRIDHHPKTGAWRIMDYKTFSSNESPLKKHLGPISHAWMQSNEVELNIGRRRYLKTWEDLQLPLYRYILEHLRGDQLNETEATTAYFNLPSDPNETGIREFTELTNAINPEAYASALSCASEVAENVSAGIFWPPQPFRDSWDDPFAALFVNGEPKASIAPESIKILKGGDSA